jgi:hypothetical protein
MNLYLVHCGYYDDKAGQSIFEGHTNLFIAALDPQSARIKAKDHPMFKEFRMHVDGLMEIRNIDGFDLNLVEKAGTQTDIRVIKHRDLAPKTTPSP